MEGAKAVRENGCIKTQKGRRITPTPKLLSGFICPYHWHFFRCFNLHICTASCFKCIRIVLILICFSNHWSIHNLCVDFLSTLFLVLSLCFLLALHYTPISSSLRLIFSLFFLNFPLIDFQSFMNGRLLCFRSHFLIFCPHNQSLFPSSLRIFHFRLCGCSFSFCQNVLFFCNLLFSPLLHTFFF